MPNESVSTVTSSKPSVDSATANAKIDDSTWQQMLEILDELTDHTHIFYDDYATACNCNCNCTCTRGLV